MSDESSETVNENQNRLSEARLATQEEQITKPAPKAKPQREKDPKKVAAGKKLAEKNRQAKAALEREVKREREMAEREQENENSAGWLPEMSFQTVLSIVGMTFTAFELYQRFRQKQRFCWRLCCYWRSRCQKSGFRNNSGAPRGTKTERSGVERSADERSPELSEAERGPKRSGAPSGAESKIRNGLSGAPTKGR